MMRGFKPSRYDGGASILVLPKGGCEPFGGSRAVLAEGRIGWKSSPRPTQ